MTCVLPPSFVEHATFEKLDKESEGKEKIGWDLVYIYAGRGGNRDEPFTVVDFPGWEVRDTDRVGIRVKREGE